MKPSLTIVAPVYRNRETLPQLHRRLVQVLDDRGESFEIIYVNDACPEDSLSVLHELASGDARVRVIALGENTGQNRAVMTGLAHASGEKVVTLDADLQDEPEFIPLMLRALNNGYHAIFAGKYGSYESVGRKMTSRLFKLTLSLLTGGRLPVRSGLFMAMDRVMVSRLLEYPISNPHILTLMGLTGLRMKSIPVRRPSRQGFASSYTTSMRFKVALQAWRTFVQAQRTNDHSQGH